MLCTEKTIPHTRCIEEAFLSCGPQPEVLENLFHTVQYIKLQQMCVVLQPEGLPSPTLLKADLQITDDATCNALHPRAITDRMICAGNPPDIQDSCPVSGS